MLKHISVYQCRPDDILAEDVIDNGTKLIAKNTVLNGYIIDKLKYCGVSKVWIYDSSADMGREKVYNSYEILKKDYEASIRSIKKITNDLVAKGRIDYGIVSQISDEIYVHIGRDNYIVQCMNSLKNADEYTFTHSINVSLYAMLIANWLKLPEPVVKVSIQAGLLHDIGKMKVPGEILNKPTRLSQDEFREMKKHTIFGYDIIRGNEEIDLNIRDSILMHHERIDGSGYPFGIKGSEIPLIARIISIADVFDAMTTNRVYKKGTTPFKAFQMFTTEGISLFDTKVLLTFLENITAHYIGMRALLDNGESGEIIFIPPRDVLNPIVKIGDRFIDFSKEKQFNIVGVF
ncbi:MAG: HD-GYP domain-containing protein [Bacillota bacterium]|nr:HD-GYP domain-containing protein [Bacillota bacterium]